MIESNDSLSDLPEGSGDGSARAVSVEDLLEHNPWIQNLARGLLHDKTLSEDVVQEVWLAALKSPPRKRQAVPAWLSKVVRSIAFRENRRNKMRSERERDPDKRPTIHEDHNGPDKITLQLETQKELMDAVLALKEPYRSAVYERYFDGRELDEIADRAGVPSSTVRTRLWRAMDQLREKLTQHYGSRHAWMALLVLLLPSREIAAMAAAADLSSATAETDAASTGISHATSGLGKVQVFGAIVLVGLIALSIWITRDSRAPEETALAEASELAEASAQASTRTLAERDTSTSQGPSTFQDGTSSITNDATSVAIVAPTHAVRVVDAHSGQPIPAAQLHFIQLTQNESLEIGETDSGGIILVPRDLIQRETFVVRAAGYLDFREPASARSLDQSYVVELEPIFDSEILVLRNGSPANNVEIEIHDGDTQNGSGTARIVTSDENGRAEYEYRDTTTHIVIDQPGFATVSMRAETPTTRVQLRAGYLRRGRVLLDGEALPNCDLGILTQDSNAERHVRSDADGYFALGRLAEDDKTQLTFKRPGQPSYRVQGIAPSDGDWIVDIPKGRFVVGHVVDAGAHPVSDGFAFIMVPEKTPASNLSSEGPTSHLKTVPLPERSRPALRLTPLSRVALDADGRFQLGPLTNDRDMKQFLWIHHGDFANHLELLSDSEQSSRLLTLSRGAEISGRLTDPNGTPMSGALLHLGDLWQFDRSSSDTAADFECIVGRARTDADGRFRFVGVPEDLKTEISLHRKALFVAAFRPDHLLSMNGLPLKESPIQQGFQVRAGDELSLVGSLAQNTVTLNVRLRDATGKLVSSACPALVVTKDGDVHRGQLGRFAQDQRFYTDHAIDRRAFEGAEILLMPSGHTWTSFRLDQVASTEFIDVELLPANATKIHLSQANATGSVLVGLPLGSRDPKHFVSLGEAERDGSITSRLPPDSWHRVFQTAKKLKAGATISHSALRGSPALSEPDAPVAKKSSCVDLGWHATVPAS